jgi:Xaa-Pro dipeptidase
MVTTQRLDRARERAEGAGVDTLLITPGSDMRYLLGNGNDSHERLTCLVLPVHGDPTLIVPKLERPGFGDLPVEVRTWVDGENPHALAAELAGRARTVALADTMPALHVLPLRELLPEANQVLATEILRELRMCKDSNEIDELADVAAAIDRVHARVPEVLRAGRTEAEVGADIERLIVEEGHTHAEFVVVGSGPNGASPHHDVSDRTITTGDIVVVDIGGPNVNGYNSDSTRTYSVGTPAPECAEIYAVLQRAQQAAVDAVRPGARAEDVDAAAREIITAAGYGDNFIHRTGHGIGLDVHEEPYVVAGNGLPLAEGMAFSIEPGVYFPGEWGARIEDIVVVTANGVRPLNVRPHELVVL